VLGSAKVPGRPGTMATSSFGRTLETVVRLHRDALRRGRQPSFLGGQDHFEVRDVPPHLLRPEHVAHFEAGIEHNPDRLLFGDGRGGPCRRAPALRRKATCCRTCKENATARHEADHREGATAGRVSIQIGGGWRRGHDNFPGFDRLGQTLIAKGRPTGGIQGAKRASMGYA